MEVNTRVKAPRNYKDDLVDSFMMACYPFLCDEGNFTSAVIDYEEAINKETKKRDVRFDRDWDKWTHSEEDYSFMQENRGKPKKLKTEED